MEKNDGYSCSFHEYEKDEKWETRKGIFTEPPKKIPCNNMVDAPLMGNKKIYERKV